MLGYAKFMKDLLTKKSEASYEPANDFHQCNVFATRSLVQKKANLGAFTIPFMVGSLDFSKDLCDLGASINLMPLAIYKKLGLGDPTPTNMRLVMADKSVSIIMGRPFLAIGSVLIDMRANVLLFCMNDGVLIVEPLAAVLLNFDRENMEEYEETIYALTGMGSYSYGPKKLDLDLKN
ncbi:uncharacterized protein LOC124885809 [Capsicum annuum]|uniref:uncharacterized protein LOC124885809 n=1 Tax=Capsicum annuum TaxID=4072 RepID=UPI001FB0C173|nr:uncharacterized protein LOC124885809 [Capsicum annuum]